MVRFLVDSGIRQFLDIGAGLPTAANTHEVAQQLAPECRVVYVDNDPMVLAHARALLTSAPEGATTYVHADLRDTGTILGRALATLDFTRPVAVMLSGVLHCIPDGDDPYAIVATLLAAVPSGSYLLLAHPASDVVTGAAPATGQINARLSEPVTFRTRDQIARFLDGLDIAEPGLVQPQDWRPEPQAPPTGPLSVWCAVARKPLSPSAQLARQGDSQGRLGR
jgi:O-methyltransferase involved in polyketide biosynthesis